MIPSCSVGYTNEHDADRLGWHLVVAWHLHRQSSRLCAFLVDPCLNLRWPTDWRAIATAATARKPHMAKFLPFQGMSPPAQPSSNAAFAAAQASQVEMLDWVKYQLLRQEEDSCSTECAPNAAAATATDDVNVRARVYNRVVLLVGVTQVCPLASLQRL